MNGDIYYALVKCLSKETLEPTVTKEQIELVKKIEHNYTLDPRNRLLKITPDGTQKIVVPFHQKKSLLRQIHDEPLGGHLR